MDNMENKNENVQDQQNAPVDGEYSFFYGHKPEDEQSNAQQTPKAEPEMPKADKKPFWKKPGTMVAGRKGEYRAYRYLRETHAARGICAECEFHRRHHDPGNDKLLGLHHAVGSVRLGLYLFLRRIYTNKLPRHRVGKLHQGNSL